MKGTLVTLVLIIGLGAISVIAEETEVVSSGAAMTVPAQVSAAARNGVTADVILTEVDRDDDPNETLPCTPAPHDCSLRQALNIANSDETATTITFADHYIITLARPLPALTEAETAIYARPDQEVHINGNNTAQSVFYITGANVTLEGLRIYGAGSGFSNVSIGGTAHQVTIAHNVIGDGDAPSGNCGQSDASYGGIYVGGEEAVPTAVRVWIYGNIIECHRGGPGDGITIVSNKVVIGQDSKGQAGTAQHNTIRWNKGYGVRIGEQADNVVCNSLMHDNQAGNLYVTNFNNDVMQNELK